MLHLGEEDRGWRSFSPHAAQPDSPGLPCLPPARALGHSSPHPPEALVYLSSCPLSARPFSLVSAGRFAELVSHHLGREVVQIQHVLEKRVFRDFILWE